MKSRKIIIPPTNCIRPFDPPAGSVMKSGAASSVASLVDEILLLAFWNDATEINFEIQHLDAHGGFCLAEPPGFGKELQFRRLVEKNGEGHFRFSINYHHPDGFSEFNSPPVALYEPMARRLCAMANVPYWHHGWTEALLRVDLGESRPLWLFVRDNVRKRIQLRLPTPAEVAEYVPRPVVIPKLKADTPASPRNHWRLMLAPNAVHATLWLALRIIFYAMTGLVAWSIAAGGGLLHPDESNPVKFVRGGVIMACCMHWLFSGYRRT